MNKAVSILFLCAAVLMVTCAKKSSNPTGPGGGSQNSNTYTYTLNGTTAISSYPQTIGTRCDSNTLMADTTPSYTDTSTIVLSNNDNQMIVTHSDGIIDTLTRVGTGSGVQGQWTSYYMDILVGPTTVTMSYNYADVFVTEMSYYATMYNISVAKVSSSSATVTGKTTHEVITVTWNDAGDGTYSSSDPSHPTAVEYFNPTTCPNDPPAWLNQFMMANAVIGKKAASALSTISNGYFAHPAKRPAHHW